MDIAWTDQLVDQLAFQWDGYFRPRLDELTDEQYLWEPVNGCWSIRQRSEAVTSHAIGEGMHVIDYVVPEPEPAPFTTVAWRMGHISIGVFGERASNHFGDEDVSYGATAWPIDAASGLELLDRHHDAWLAGVAAMSADDLARPCGPHEGTFADRPFAQLVLHINREALHHAAEIAAILDLYARRASLHA